MGEKQLWEQIKCAQNEKGQALLVLIEKFSPLIYKYVGLLGYEDAKNDLICDFISLILGFNTRGSVSYDDPSVLSYIKKSIHRSYIARSILKDLEKQCRPMNMLSESEQLHVESISAKTDSHEGLLIDEMKDVLNVHEFAVVYQHFFLGFSIEEIALKLKTSRQSINQTKKRALKKLETTIFKL